MYKMIFVCIIAAMLCSCVMPDSEASPVKSSQSSVVLTVNGNAVSGEELVKNPNIRQGLEQILMIYGLKTIVAVEGITLDKKIVDERMEEVKAEVLASGQSFEEMMEMRGTNEADFTENIRIGLLVDELLESRLEYTDEEVRAMWDINPDRFTNIYARENSLTDNEKTALTFEDVYDTVFQAFKDERFREMSVDLQQEVIDSIDLKFTCIADSEERKYFEDLFINTKKSTYVEPEITEVVIEDATPIVKHEDDMPVETDATSTTEASDDGTADEASEDESTDGEETDH